jgi:hypothetical protein
MAAVCREAGRHQEEAALGGGRVLREADLQRGGPPESKRAEIVLFDPCVGEQELLHLFRRQALLEAEPVLGLGMPGSCVKGLRSSFGWLSCTHGILQGLLLSLSTT